MLTKREKMCLKLSAMDKKSTEIAEQLFISEQTVKKHLKNIRRKLSCLTIQGAVYKATRDGILK